MNNESDLYTYTNIEQKENYNYIIQKSYINVDSSSIENDHGYNIENNILLDEKSLSFTTTNIIVGINTSSKNILRINCPNHDFKKDDLIILKELNKKMVDLYSTYKSLSNTTEYAIIFTPNSSSVIFVCNYDEGINKSPMSFNPNFSVGSDGINHDKLRNYDTNDMFVDISGFNGDTNPFIGNIPINFLNGRHQVYFTNPDYTIVDGNVVYSDDTIINIPTSGIVNKITGFYINLNKKYSGDPISSTVKISITFNYIGGYPINKINTEFPTNNNHLYGYHKIYATTKNTIDIAIDKQTYYVDENSNPISFGNLSLYIAKLTMIFKNVNKNNFTIPLTKDISDVLSIKMINSVFPNTIKNITDTHNKLYWQNEDDGNITYNIEIDSGYYDMISLKNIIESKISDTKRQYVDIDSCYTDKNIIYVDINENTNITTFTSYKQGILSLPIQSVDYDSENNTYTLTIKQQKHGLSANDTVRFTNLINTNGISSEILNTQHIVSSIISEDEYTIVLQNINLLSDTTVTYGGYGNVYVDNRIKILFNYNDTIGKILGFRNVGENDSITKYNNIIKNSDEYEYEYVIIQNNKKYIYNDGIKQLLIGNKINDHGNNYLKIYINDIKNVSESDGTSYFSKIILTKSYGLYEYDTYVDNYKIFDYPIEFYNLNIKIYNNKNELYDIGNLNFSFVLEITSVKYLPIY